MDIDKIYRILGTSFKRVWYNFFQRPIKNVNVENRAFKKIERSIPKAAPWHETTKHVIEELKKDSQFHQTNEFNQQLFDRLKSVKVVSENINLEPEHNSNEPIDKLPKSRLGADLPYVFYTNEPTPRGKINVSDTLDMLIDLKRGDITISQAANQHGIDEGDIEQISKYVDLFRAVNVKLPPVPAYEYKDTDPEKPRLSTYENEHDMNKSEGSSSKSTNTINEMQSKT